MSITSIAANAIQSTPIVTSVAQRNFPTASAGTGTSTAATGSSDPFLGLSAELQSMLVQLQGGATTQATAGTATTNAVNLSQTLSASMQQALQAYAGTASSEAVPTANF